ncbi:ABC transporter ATP-binding protein [Oceanobacillus senegalensis]|uniref:ABC transporter ATP-binding protein n=1 Tax=Oceanobacillus senegalensis TaxID=1936063 RepID=UPI000A304879|nr:ATP-binding cassette domain-containing protein [Oceanobacillus senegalensis]
MEKQVNSQPPILQVENFSLSFLAYKKGLIETKTEVIKRLDMTIHKGEIVAVVGASGSGKSLLANAILGILPEHAICKGTLKFKGEILNKACQEKLRGKAIFLIPQSVKSLDPLMKTGKQVRDAIHSKNKKELQQEIFKNIGLPKETEEKYPFELSGGMARRILAATAMVSPAELIVADEPTPGLDPKVLKETTIQMKKLAKAGKGIMFITHDIESALEIADRVVVFHEGETIEVADAEAFTGKGEQLNHPYTKALWNALPGNEFFKGKDNLEIEEDDEKLEVKGISFKYRNQPFLFKNLHVTVHSGEIVGIHGYSGSGKTTMAQVIAGYLKPDEGDILLNGNKIKRSGKQTIQYIWQHPEKAINPRWRMRKVLEESGMEKSPITRELGIKNEWLSRWPSELSGGELQRFCIARVLHDETRFLIADEMTTMLDAVTQAKLWEIIVRLVKERNIGVLAISHDHKLLKRISDRIINFNEISHKK